MKYIEQHHKSAGCVFCLETQRLDGLENLIIRRGQKAYVILNRFPYSSGHLMVVPFDHEELLELLDVETRIEMMELLARSTKVLRAVYQPAGFNLGANIGAAAGAGVAGHIHLHVVPRWEGDTNFMSTLGQTRVLPEELGLTYQRVRQAWDSLP
jgi:ATP adenylyltransferase